MMRRRLLTIAIVLGVTIGGSIFALRFLSDPQPVVRELEFLGYTTNTANGESIEAAFRLPDVSVTSPIILLTTSVGFNMNLEVQQGDGWRNVPPKPGMHRLIPKGKDMLIILRNDAVEGVWRVRADLSVTYHLPAFNRKIVYTSKPLTNQVAVRVE